MHLFLILILTVDESLEQVALMEDNSDDNYNTSDTERGNVFTVEDAVESIGFGFFQIRLYIICGLFTVSKQMFQYEVAVYWVNFDSKCISFALLSYYNV